MSTLIYKPANIPLLEEDIRFEIIFQRPHYITLAYSKNNKIFIKKFKEAKLSAAWKCLESLTDYNLIAFFHNKKEKLFEKDENNLSPISINDELSYIAVGPVLTLSKKNRKRFSDVFYFKNFLFEKMLKNTSFDLFFTYAGKWLLEQVIPSISSIAFIKNDGSVSIINEDNGQFFQKMWFFDSELARKKLIAKS